MYTQCIYSFSGFALFCIFWICYFRCSRKSDLCVSYSSTGDMSGSQFLRALGRTLGLGRSQLKVDSRHVVVITGCDSGLG